ncbi:DNA polymerase III subunit beta [Psychrobium sp. 1_MG-2023]|uniref:DNA polymerase III subunit beta n=1 Tax=Psychrobium sp. 1_MG-2023 TaxID=3062624 RepID=UPI000C32B253|nr:DNA polymerase III subunit beta [Psychrobium sp. 1_MG-2023]MDP2560510.1 DNA polymerase III subunit beta [Psychrobium sp. 1_MG-2023]PKF55206.1 DNA polymerase III subunit beta [Alteromonadales bacterium alter-6D02]
MKFTISREQLLKPLTLVSGAVERRHTLAVLSNVMLEVEPNALRMTGSDLEVELIGLTPLEGEVNPGRTTVPAKKFLDICKGLPDGADILIDVDGERMIIRSGRSRFSLSTLPADDFPNIDNWQSETEFVLPQHLLRSVIESTQFSMANQDVRYYLNGMLFETNNDQFRTVATDGHRLAVSSRSINAELPSNQVIVPRKGVVELLRLIEASDEPVTVQIGDSHLRANINNAVFTTKLVDGRFPDYQRVLPRGGDKEIITSRVELKQALARASILSNEKFRGVRFNFSTNELKITANNPEQEESQEIVDLNYAYDDLEIGFNVSYVLDALNALKSDEIKLTLGDANSSGLIEAADSSESMYVVMPMRL